MGDFDEKLEVGSERAEFEGEGLRWLLISSWCSMILFFALVILTFAFIFAYYYYIAVQEVKNIYKHQSGGSSSE